MSGRATSSKSFIHKLQNAQKSQQRNVQTISSSKYVVSAISKLLQRGAYSDVTIEVHDENNEEQQKTMNLHKAILAIQSRYFDALLSKMKEAQQKVVVIKEDLGIDNFTRMIEFMYTGEVDISRHNLMNMLMLADKYEVNSLLEILDAQVKFHIVEPHALDLLQWGRLSAFPTISAFAVRAIVDNFIEIAGTETWNSLSVEVIQQIIYDCMRVSPMKKLIALSRWVRHNYEERRKYSAELLRHIQLSELTPDQLVNDTQQISLFSTDTAWSTALMEVLRFKLGHIALGLRSIPTKHSFPSSINHHKIDFAIQRLNKVALCAYPPTECDEETHKIVDTITFSPSKWVSLVAIGVYPPHSSKDTCVMTFRVKTSRKLTSTVEFTANITGSDDPQPTVIFLPEVVSIESHTDAYIEICLEGATTYCGEGGVPSKFSLHGVTITFKNCPSSISTVERGQIPFLYFQLPTMLF